MPKTFHDAFLAEVEAFLLRHGMAASRLGSLAVSDHRFVANLRQGRSPRLSTADTVRAWMRDFRPRRRTG